jgi:cytoskeletal protein RodZ
MDQQLMLGILLIIVGAAFALIAVAVVLNRRTDEKIEEAELDELEPAQADPADVPESVDAEPAAAEDAREPESVAEAPAPSADLPIAPEDGSAVNADALEQVAEVEAEEPIARGNDMSLLVSVLRDQDSGSLVLRVGDKEFRTVEQMRDRSQREAIAAALDELVAWFAAAESAASPDMGGETSASGMVQAIDAILQRTLESAAVSERGVRLVSDASGGVKVLIGVKSYELEEVPNQQIRDLIREAVAEWEASQ